MVSVLRVLSDNLGFRLHLVQETDCNPPLQWNSFDCTLKSTGQNVPLVKVTNNWYTLDVLERESNLFVTRPIVTFPQAGLLYREKADHGYFQIFAPFTLPLWLTIIGVTALTALLLPCVLRDGDGQRLFRVTRPHVYYDSMYHMTADLLGGGDLEWTQGYSARLLRMGWLFVILVSTTSYTANLAAFFTAPSFHVFGPHDMQALSKAKACMPINNPKEGAYWPNRYGVGQMLGGLTYSLARADMPGWNDMSEEERQSHILGTYTTMSERFDACAEKVKRKEADIIIFDRPQLQLWHLSGGKKRCLNWIFAPDVSFHDTFVHLSFNNSYGYDFFIRFQQGLLWLQHHGSMDHMHVILQKEFKRGETCPVVNIESDKISLESQIGLFIIFGVICFLALLLALYESVPRKIGQAKEEDEGEAAMTDGELLRELVQRTKVIETVMHSEHVDETAL